jgi:AAA+ superfamily predicted ATPase
LKSQKKEIIKALVTVHLAGSKEADVVESKGNGLVVLLDGSSGTGKTLTAESVAEIAEKPLYRVTCGDIGTDPEGVERYLESVLVIGITWGCVVLLDEADVFLEERSQTDLVRNAIVSVFLCVLEYYEGILIMTSNRVGTFDEAFKSRVQPIIHYPKLEEDGRYEIWRNFIFALHNTGTKMELQELERNIAVLSRQKMNSRQIRNMFRIARQLAMYTNEMLTYTHLEQVIDIANAFEEYLMRGHGHDDDIYARELGTRFD